MNEVKKYVPARQVRIKSSPCADCGRCTGEMQDSAERIPLAVKVNNSVVPKETYVYALVLDR